MFCQLLHLKLKSSLLWLSPSPPRCLSMSICPISCRFSCFLLFCLVSVCFFYIFFAALLPCLVFCVFFSPILRFYFFVSSFVHCGVDSFSSVPQNRFDVDTTKQKLRVALVAKELNSIKTIEIPFLN